jgi:hypothetical protein
MVIFRAAATASVQSDKRQREMLHENKTFPPQHSPFLSVSL